MKAIIVLLVCALCFEGLNAKCPAPEALKDANGAKLCAQLFEDSHYYYDKCCGGKVIDVYPGDDVPIMPVFWNNRASSLVVAKFCSLTVWDHFKKEGTKKKFSAGVQYRLEDVKMGLFQSWDNDISGYYCEC